MPPCLFDWGLLLIVTQIEYAWYGRKSWGEFVPVRPTIRSLTHPPESILVIPRRAVSRDGSNREGADYPIEQVSTWLGDHLGKHGHV